MFVDIKKADLNGKLKGDEVAFIDRPELWCEPGKCGNLRRWLYGMGHAANASRPS